MRTLAVAAASIAVASIALSLCDLREAEACAFRGPRITAFPDNEQGVPTNARILLRYEDFEGYANRSFETLQLVKVAGTDELDVPFTIELIGNANAGTVIATPDEALESNANYEVRLRYDVCLETTNECFDTELRTHAAFQTGDGIDTTSPVLQSDEAESRFTFGLRYGPLSCGDAITAERWIKWPEAIDEGKVFYSIDVDGIPAADHQEQPRNVDWRTLLCRGEEHDGVLPTTIAAAASYTIVATDLAGNTSEPVTVSPEVSVSCEGAPEFPSEEPSSCRVAGRGSATAAFPLLLALAWVRRRRNS